MRASAPGRVNLIGEHTDYNGGYVLPTPIPQRCHALLARREDDVVRAVSAQVPATPASAAEVEGAPSTFRLGHETPTGTWLDYVQGVTWALAQAGNTPPRGFDLLLDSQVPLGSGLSSSAALEVAVLRALRDAFSLSVDDLDLARLGQRAENGFVGARTGIMDQVAASLGQPGCALFLDTRDLRYEQVPLPPRAQLLVIDSGIRHRLAAGDGGYNARRAECERAAALLGVAQLRDLGLADLARVEALPEPLNRRARHVVTENARVLEAVAALRAGDLPRLGALFDASHASMRDDFQVSTPEIDHLVSLARAEPGVYGARLTGGGFGGCMVALTGAGQARRLGARIAAAYAVRTGGAATVRVPHGQPGTPAPSPPR